MARGLSRLRLVLQGAAVGLVLALLALLVWKVAFDSGGSQVVSDVRAGKEPRAPAFELQVIWDEAGTWPAALRPKLADGRIALAELRGYPVVLNFWASWCAPCEDEAPAFAQAAVNHAGRVVFLGVDVQDFTGDARKFLREHEVPYVSVRDGGPSTYDDFGLTGLPETYFIDSRGRIVEHSVGEVTRDQLESGIDAALATG